MKQKTARFNYLEDKQGGNEGKIDSERYEYRHIINKLTKEHHYQNVLKEYYKDQLKDKREVTPIVKNALYNEDKKNSQIKSIILNQNINLQRIKTQKNEHNLQKRDAYRMIKESHIVKDQDFQQFYQNSKSPTHRPYENTPKQIKVSDYKYSYNPIKFYQIKLEHTPPKKKINSHKNNEPYINQLYSGNSSSYGKTAVNPQVRNHSPLKTGTIGQSQLKSNQGYKVQKSQEGRYYDQKRDLKKRSCFDYVPKQLKQKLTRAREFEY